MATIDHPRARRHPRGLMDRIRGLQPKPKPKPVADPPPAGAALSPWREADVTAGRTIEGFVASASDLLGVRRITARSSGPTVLIRLTTDRPRHEVVDDLEPRLRSLILSGAPFEYSVIETSWGEADPPGFVEVWRAALAVAR